MATSPTSVVKIHLAPQEVAEKQDDNPSGGVEMVDVRPKSAESSVPQKDKSAFVANLTMAFKDVSVVVKVPEVDPGFKTVITPVVSLFKGIATCGASNRTKDFARLNAASGILKPGTMTLVMAPPGHGKSTYLKALAGRLPTTSGTLLYNGRTAEEAAKEGCRVLRMTQFIDQVDNHLPLLTVRETLDFAHKVSAVEYEPARVENMVKQLGLEECEHTVLGNAFIRGVSGGQKRRVTIGEMLMGDSCALFMDEYSNGLDTATAEDITRGLRKWVDSTNSTIVATLQQPTPGLFALFDNVVCLKDSTVVYDGPRDDLLPFFESMGFKCPSDVDVCDFLIDSLFQPRIAIDRLRHLNSAAGKSAAAKLEAEAEKDDFKIPSDAQPHGAHSNGASSPRGGSSVVLSTGEVLKNSAVPCVTTAAMVAHYHASPIWHRIERELDAYFPSSGAKVDGRGLSELMPTAKAREAFGNDYSLPVMSLLAMNMQRQWIGLKRNKSLIIPRVAQGIFMGLLYGSLYYKIGTDQFFLRVASLLICLTQIAFGNMVELPMSVGANRIIYKHVSARFYPSWTYVFAASCVGIPLTLLEICFLPLVIYFLSAATYEPGVFFTFFAVVLVQAFLMATWFRMLSAVARDEASAQALAGPSTGVFMLFGGFFVTLNNMPVFMQWIFWVSPFSWSVRALANNEFLSSRYDTLTGNPLRRLGDDYIEALDMLRGKEWIGYAVLYLLALSLLCMIGHARLLDNPFKEQSRGTMRFDDEPESLENDDDEKDEGENALRASAIGFPGTENATLESIKAPELVPAPTALSRDATGVSQNGSVGSRGSRATLRTLREAVPYVPTWLSFSEVRYTVQVVKDGVKTDRVLLGGISGYAEPGKLTALMGASGAGKTTLLDVLAGRKTAGVIEGKILFNGSKPTPLDFARVTGYVEQFDSLLPTDTVRETLTFAAKLRLPRDLPDATKEIIVDEVLEILDLKNIQDFLIGNHVIPGLSPSQLKRVNIGCELVANPSILFLDEPTTGLDSRSAQTVMRVARRIARSGRSVVCTIHQPSAELFFLFDRLVLLASGGHQVFFGDLGSRSKSFIKYLSAIPQVNPIAPRYNPASWMLEELGVGVAAMRDDKKLDGETGGAPATNGTGDATTDKGKDAAAAAAFESSADKVKKFKAHYYDSRLWKRTRAKLDALEAIGAGATAAAVTAAANGASPSVAPRTLLAAPPAENAPAPGATPDVVIAATALAAQQSNAAPVVVVHDSPAQAQRQRSNSQASDKDEEEHSVTRGEKTERKASFSAFSQASAPLPGAGGFSVEKALPTLWQQYVMVQARAIKSYHRNPPFLFSRLRTVVFLSVLFGLIYLNLKVTTQASVISYIAAIQVTVTFGSLIHGATATPAMMEYRAVFYRERSSGMYSPFIWPAAQFVTELIWCAFGAIVLQVPVYWMVGFTKDAAIYFKFLLVCYLTCLIFIAMSTLVVSIAPTMPAAGVIQGTYFGLFFTFSGVAITTPNIPAGYVWLFRMLPMSHVTEALVMPQFSYCSPLPLCGPTLLVYDGGVQVTKFVPQVVQEYLGFSYEAYWEQIGWICLYLGVVLILAFRASTKLVFSTR